MILTITKCHGSNNEFFIIDETKCIEILNPGKRKKMAIRLCDRTNELGGSDGLLFYQDFRNEDCRMLMYNPDGSEAQMCGNGMRCFARYASEKLSKTDLVIQTQQAALNVKKVADIRDGIPTFETEIEPVSFSPDTISSFLNSPLIDAPYPGFFEPQSFTAISVPNPHLIFFVTDLDEALLRRLGESANQDKVRFSQGINVSMVRQDSDRELTVWTYERGAGLTNACGTAMSASTYVAAELARVSFDADIIVNNRGEAVRCRAVQEPKPKIYLAGNATFLFEARINMTDTVQIISCRPLDSDNEGCKKSSS